MNEDGVERLFEHVRNAERLRSDVYEEVTATILESKLQQISDVHTVRHHHNLECDFGYKQMDVYLQLGDGEDEITAIVECKGRNSPMEKDHLASFAFYLEHSDADKGIYVSRSGYRSGAKRIAKECGIQLFEISQITDGAIKSVDGTFTHRFGPYRHHVFVKDPKSQDWMKLSEGLYSIHEQLELPILDRSGDPTGDTLEDRLPGEEEEGTVEIEFEDGEMVQVNGNEYELWQAISHPQPDGGDGSSFKVDFEDRIDLKLRDVLADQSEYVLFDDIKRQFLRIEREN
ncbi:hypothetical protein EA462_01000 [Natrarchaeobius halalkaliphilus]|uniref:Restriction endonuclease type IV Mrr domain-containing protein n=1 Tax=Natrarchaeobius halalkaliphilus TaxID=1679091 RepID=A0A3N6P9D2_9EURY|nr:restriction endonuclease [Natrarchaeobius halalkaliphilus]RQG92835.1 hypothetical protein EA462_01000 [Natrarchaeobius halalkaliphilus]